MGLLRRSQLANARGGGIVTGALRIGVLGKCKTKCVLGDGFAAGFLVDEQVVGEGDGEFEAGAGDLGEGFVGFDGGEAVFDEDAEFLECVLGGAFEGFHVAGHFGEALFGGFVVGVGEGGFAGGHEKGLAAEELELGKGVLADVEFFVEGLGLELFELLGVEGAVGFADGFGEAFDVLGGEAVGEGVLG